MKFNLRLSLSAMALRGLALALVACCVLTSSACGQEEAGAKADTDSAEQADGEAAEEEKKQRPTIDLGKFVIKDLRPTRNETAKVTFSAHLAFSKELTKDQAAKLEGWKHRLRDQVITATRISHLVDFQEPDLSLFRRKILIRVNRMFKVKVAEDVLLTEYLFRLH